MTDVEERTINLIVEVTGIQRKRIQLSSRLVDDIGMDGDDAIDFFEKFGQNLHVDLDVLYEHWDNHFFPEGFGGMSVGYLVIIGAHRRGRSCVCGCEPYPAMAGNDRRHRVVFLDLWQVLCRASTRKNAYYCARLCCCCEFREMGHTL
jgi:hypothetical protein